ncbi:MAG TPA: type III pantothenate kinase [Thiobacillus sp.]|nr:MAG: type III pantothenate kinase [Hydrogenophilales bacterium 28-61-11]OYZ56518.1 MAG: type III pantothenate kinase [Hydrogenophilales bacterium 16-61-112]OZA43210.1 MAG: type III pantothenate kinase [Hydrogenophilales bacterium 17-61-76]HQT30844.1 type III pantothenate kinase [Thiobacillus sp.]HQT69648.1 type III pantothenate kinase [Thiobacillus sp.]
MSVPRLLVDAGNTRVKWVLVTENLWSDQGDADYADLSALTQKAPARIKCAIASVAGSARNTQLSQLLLDKDITPVWLESGERFLDLKNLYSTPSQLGVDRWMSLIAARQRHDGASLVVSLGTAMTIDALSTEGEYLGGVIIPGYRLMQRSLHEGTAQIGSENGSWQAFPRNTADAVQSGIVAAMCGAILLQHARLAEKCRCIPLTLLTGGDAGMLMPYLDLPVEQVPCLVLEGIEQVTRKGWAG